MTGKATSDFDARAKLLRHMVIQAFLPPLTGAAVRLASGQGPRSPAS